jgi:hypothetical protein
VTAEGKGKPPVLAASHRDGRERQGEEGPLAAAFYEGKTEAGERKTAVLLLVISGIVVAGDGDAPKEASAKFKITTAWRCGPRRARRCSR